MIIGFDGKRAFQNKTGLGNYSRSLVTILANYFPQNRYILFAPRHTNLFDLIKVGNAEVRTPLTFMYKRFGALWRRRGMVKDIAAAGLNIYHGLSNELPQGIEKAGVKTVVTIHDLIFERFPETYNFDERYTHRWKIKRACKVADAVIAISLQTKEDLVNYYGVKAHKIFTCYQSCNPIFQQTCTVTEKELVKKRYELPDKYFLFVGSIAPRKNLLAICKAMVLLKKKTDIPLVVIGDGKKEKEEAKKFMNDHGLSNRLLLLNDLSISKGHTDISVNDFPAIYQLAVALIYPSLFEGFGLPILEALWSKLPVICSNSGAMPEVGGDAVLYFAPDDINMVAHHMLDIATNNILAKELSEKGLTQAQKFAPEKYAESIMQVYNQLL